MRAHSLLIFSLAVASHHVIAGKYKAKAVGLWPSVEMLSPRLEQLQFIIPCSSVENFVHADDVTWSKFLAEQKGFVRKTVLLDSNYTSANGGNNCSVWSSISWASLELWKAIDPDALAATAKAFAEAFGSDPPPIEFPAPVDESTGYNGLEIKLDVPLALQEPFPAKARLAAESASAAAALASGGDNPKKWAPAEEIIRFKIKSCELADIDAFVAADNATWTQYENSCAGFIRKITLVEDDISSCYIWTHSRWASRTQWEDCDNNTNALMATAQAFEEMLGYSPEMERWPSASSLTVLRERELPRGPRTVAIAGNDVVAYQTLKPGVDFDVKGSPDIIRVLPSAALFDKSANPSALAMLHPADYEFWFSSEENAVLFDQDPMRYIPAFGGHCTHGIANLVDGDLTPAQMVDGRLAFVCVNTTNWGKVVNGTLYMNSCGMYDDFMVDPEGDIAKASAVWESWFGAPYDTTGPINDACFQNGYTWGGPPNWVAGLMPPACNII